ncbi:MAG: hypothetical protein AAGD40_10745 [Pseudomonadota bacterium]
MREHDEDRGRLTVGLCRAKMALAVFLFTSAIFGHVAWAQACTAANRFTLDWDRYGVQNLNAGTT